MLSWTGGEVVTIDDLIAGYAENLLITLCRETEDHPLLRLYCRESFRQFALQVLRKVLGKSDQDFTPLEEAQMKLLAKDARIEQLLSLLRALQNEPAISEEKL